LLLYNEQLDEAIEQFETMFEETGGGNLFFLVQTYWQKGMHEKAIEWAETRVSVQGRSDPRFPLLLRQMASGNRDDAMRTIEDWKELTPRRRAMKYAWFGEKDLAIEWLTKAVDERYHGIGWANVEPAFDSIRDDPRFQDLMRRINLEP
jgi:tetratricopeptide (TPR) repeat protein